MTVLLEHDAYAYLGIYSERPLSDIARHVGRDSEAGSSEIREPRRDGSAGRYKVSAWKMHSGLARRMPLDEHVAALWRRIKPIRHAVSTLPGDMTGTLHCVGHFQSHLDSFCLAAGHFSTAAFYRLGIDFDFYFGNNFGDMEAPYWDWG